jgi:phosphate transport system protein
MERHLDEELNELKGKLLGMAALAEGSISKAIKALVERDKKLADEVIKSDDAINMLDIEVDDHCLKLLALKQPAATDLRFIASAMKINSDLERIGDLSVNIAQRALDLMTQPLLKPLIDIPRMAQLSQKMVKDSLDAFVNRNAELAQNVCLRDDEVDQLNRQIFRELLTFMMEDAKTITRCVDLLLVGRHLERIADHATNIGEDVFYMVKGKSMKHHLQEKLGKRGF